MGYPVEALQGNLGQLARDRIVARFRAGRTPILLATNVAARGLDMLNIDRVINYDLPETPDLFTHRVGRTARIGRSGEAITLLTVVDLPKMQEIERALGRKLRRVDASALQPVALPRTEMLSGRRPAAVSQTPVQNGRRAAAPQEPIEEEAAVATASEEAAIQAAVAVKTGVSSEKRRRRRGRRRPLLAAAGA